MKIKNNKNYNELSIIIEILKEKKIITDEEIRSKKELKSTVKKSPFLI